MGKLVLSHRLDLLVKHLAQAILEEKGELLQREIIVVPSGAMKQWVLIQIATHSKEKGIAGCKVMTLQEAIQTFFKPATFTEIFCSVYQELLICPDEEVQIFLAGSPKRGIELANELTRLFIRYGNYSRSLFEANSDLEGWQKKLIDSLFVKGSMRLPVQMAPLSLPPIHGFGLDYLPPALWNLLSFSSLYLFSPCLHYWEDLCTDRERRRLGRYWRRKGASEERQEELNSYLANVPPLLANWGKVGRETLKILDGYPWETEEDYDSIPSEKPSALTRLKERLLHFEEIGADRFLEDRSIQLVKTGSSRLKEIEWLRRAILEYVQETGALFSDISVFAPDIQSYASLIQLVFTDLPIRISGLESGSKSQFYQGLQTFFNTAVGSEDLISLFENGSFSKARGWDLGELKQIREWISSDDETLLNQSIHLSLEDPKRIPLSAAKGLEQFLEARRSIQIDQGRLKESRTLRSWAELLSEWAEKYFAIDLLDEVEVAAWTFFKQAMREFSTSADDRLFPFEVIHLLLKRGVPSGQLHSSHLHAIRFATLNEGDLIPAKAIFLIGMDEENFPRKSISSSLDLLRGKTIYTLESVDQDRYLFLRALFAAEERLYFSYGHLSPEGNPVNPSPLIDELIANLDAPISPSKAPARYGPKLARKFFPWPHQPSLERPEGEITVSLAELSLLARHPWEFYLQKVLGIRFEKEKDFSFARERGMLLRANLQGKMNRSELAEGICKRALELEVEETSEQWRESLQSWGIEIEPIVFYSSANERKKLEKGWEYPALKMSLGTNLKVKIVGELKHFSEKGYVHTGADRIDALLRVWPECLLALLVGGKREIYCLRSGRIRSIENPEESLCAFLSYYFLAQSAPSPFLVQWADGWLKKGFEGWDKQVQDQLIGNAFYEDPIAQWTIDRISLPPLREWFEEWNQPIRDTFSSLSVLYEGRRKHATV